MTKYELLKKEMDIVEAISQVKKTMSTNTHRTRAEWNYLLDNYLALLVRLQWVRGELKRMV